jgi:hypothetical protein
MAFYELRINLSRLMPKTSSPALGIHEFEFIIHVYLVYLIERELKRPESI